MLMLCGELSGRLLGLGRRVGLEKAMDGIIGYRRGFGGIPLLGGGGDRKCFSVICCAVSAWAYSEHR